MAQKKKSMPEKTAKKKPRSLALEHWKTEPDEHDYPAALDYLTLVQSLEAAEAAVERLKTADLTHRKAKDLLRASRLEILPTTNVHVMADLAKVKAGKSLSPVLLVRGMLESDVPLTIADGYHRICASYWLDENADIPCRLVAQAATRTASSRRANSGKDARAQPVISRASSGRAPRATLG
jgi:hypothetical protein